MVKLKVWLILLRPTWTLAAISQVWLVVWLAFTVEPAEHRAAGLTRVGLGGALGLTAVMAGGLTAAAAALHDVLDRRRDRRRARPRPIATGRLAAEHAVIAAVAGLVLAIGAGSMVGTASALAVALASLGVMFHAAADRIAPGAGWVMLGLIVALLMAAANPSMSLVWPVLLSMTHVIGCGVVWHRLSGRRPRLGRLDGWALVGGWLFWSMVGMGVMRARGGTQLLTGEALVGPAIAAGGFLVVATAMARYVEDTAGGRRFARLAAGWLVVYGVAWLAGCGPWGAAGTIVIEGLVMIAVAAGVDRLGGPKDTEVRYRVLGDAKGPSGPGGQGPRPRSDS